MKRPLALGLAAALLLAAGGGAALHWRNQQQRAEVLVASAPLAPDLSAWAPELGRRIAACEQRVHAGPDPLPALGELSRLYHANGFHAEARQCYEGLEQLQPDEPRWFHRHALILAGFGEIDEALRLWQHVAEIAPDYRPARLRLADLHIKADDFAAARAEYEKVLARFPAEPYAILGLARCEIQAERWSAARPLLEKLVAQTDFMLGYDLIVTMYERLGLTDEAARIRGMYRASGGYRDAPDPWLLELDDDCYNSYQLSLASGAAERNQDIPLARRRIEQAIAISPDEGTLHFQYGALLLRQKQYSAAREQFETATRISPTFSDGWAFLSSVLETVGDRDGALRVLAQGLKHCPNSPGLHLQNARNLMREHKVEEAIEQYRIAIRLRPNEADAYLGLATTLITLGRKEEGLEQVDQALVAEPEHPIALSIRAFDAILDGNELMARRWMQRVVDQPRSTDSDKQRLASAYRQQFGHDFR